MKTNLNDIISRTRKGQIAKSDAVRIASVDIRFKFRSHIG